MRHAKLNARLVPMRATGQVFARVLEVSVSTRTGAPSLYPTVTVAFSNDEAELRVVTRHSFGHLEVVHDLTEDKLAAVGLKWEDGRFWTEEERDREAWDDDDDESSGLPGLVDEEEVEAAAEAAASALDLERRADWAALASEDAEREAADAADEASAAVAAAAELEQAAGAAAALMVGGRGSGDALEAADKMAARGQAEAERALLEAQRRCEAAATAAVAAADAAARVSPVAQVTPAVTRSRSVLSVALEARAAREREEAAGAAAAAEASTAAAAAAEKAARCARGEQAQVRREWEVAAAAKKMGFKMMAGGIKKLVAAGYGVDEIEGMCGVGVEVLDEVLADAVRGGAAFNAVEKVALRGYMAAKARPSAAPDAAPREDMEGRFIDIEEVESVESGLDGAEEDEGATPASPRRVLFKEPASARAKAPDSRFKVLVAMLTKADAAKFALFGVTAIAEALLDRDPRKSETTFPGAVLELWLVEHVGVSMAACKEAATAEVDDLCMWLMGVIGVKEAERPRARGGGGGGGSSGGAGSEAMGFAAILAAGGASGQQSDPALWQALSEAARDSSLVKDLEEVKGFFGKGESASARAKLAEVCARPCVAAIYYKGSDVKHTQGSAMIPGANNIVLLIGAVRERVESDVAREVQALLPPGCDAREFSRRVLRGKLDEIDIEKIFGSKAGASVMPAAVKEVKSKGGVDSTDEPSLVFMRGIALMMLAYPYAHPFDAEAAAEWARLLSDIARANQSGLTLVEAVAVILDPVVQELSTRWRDVGRGMAASRPRMKEVVAALKDKVGLHLRQRLEMRKSVAHGGGGSGGKGEDGKKGGGGEAADAAMKKLAKQAEQAVRLAKEAKAAAAGRTPGFGRGGGGNSGPSQPASLSAAAEWLKAAPENANKCFYFETQGSCNRGKSCRFFAGSVGHNE